ncbi:DUF1828 domain-containing protein [Rickettsia asembonensis]|uniref:DUF1828 domain-containing protein n=1 Tax=Rickettsia asembonensis TaxID=1068590 RepID=UPI0023F63D22|nr:DUF1828 domain-containing protein [Rickettsia asembonensis]WCR55945.1 MAG: hypothetical protein PG979_000002 [Rickettsia asembonensis]
MREILQDLSILFKNAKSVEEVCKNIVCITTPYLDRHNDYIQIYCTKDANDYVLTDDCWTLDNLEQSVLILDTARNEVLKAKLNKCGISRKGTELYIKTCEAELNIAQEIFARAIFEINSVELGL